jgi:hypothetical protein
MSEGKKVAKAVKTSKAKKRKAEFDLSESDSEVDMVEEPVVPEEQDFESLNPDAQAEEFAAALDAVAGYGTSILKRVLAQKEVPASRGKSDHKSFPPPNQS